MVKKELESLLIHLVRYTTKSTRKARLAFLKHINSTIQEENMEKGILTFLTALSVSLVSVSALASVPGYNSSYWYKTRTVHVKTISLDA